MQERISNPQNPTALTKYLKTSSGFELREATNNWNT